MKENNTDLGNPFIKAGTSMLLNKASSKNKINEIVTGRNKSDVELEIYKAENRRKNNILVFKVFMGIALSYGSYRFGKKLIKNFTEKQQSPKVQYAKRLRVAMFPSGIKWLPDGTNEKEIKKVAYEIVNNPTVSFSDVQIAYKKLYSDSLSDHLQKELNSEEYGDLMKILSETYNPNEDNNNPNYYTNGKMIVMSKDTDMYGDAMDIFAKQTLKKNSYFKNASTTGNTKKVAFVGYFNKQTRIEIKQNNGNKTAWLNADGIKTLPFTNENIAKFRSAKYLPYNLK